MDEVLKEATRQVPSLVVLVVLVVLFLRRMQASDETQKALGPTRHESQRQSIRVVEVLEETSAALPTKCTELIAATKSTIDRVEKRLDREAARSYGERARATSRSGIGRPPPADEPRSRPPRHLRRGPRDRVGLPGGCRPGLDPGRPRCSETQTPSGHRHMSSTPMRTSSSQSQRTL